MPGSMCPPGGESLEEVRARLHPVVKDIARKHKAEATLLVARPVAAELLRRILDGRGLEGFWQQTEEPFVWDSYEMDARTL